MPSKRTRPARTAGKRKPPARTKRNVGVATRWEGLRPMYDFWGGEIRRHYKLETLANATERYIGVAENFITASIHEVLGRAPLTSLRFELFQEGRHQLIFRLTAANANRNRETFGFVVAKNSAEHSALARTEHANLGILHERMPQFVVRAFGGGNIYLPDRHGRREQGREVYAYVTQWLKGFHELGVERDLQFFINATPPHKFTKVQTEELKTRAVEIVFRSYDGVRHNCMELPQIASGDLVVSKPGAGALKLKLIACRKLLMRMSPPKLVHTLIDTRWDWGGREFRLVPESPENLLEALRRARGREDAAGWLSAYRKALDYGNLPETGYLSREVLGELIAS